MAMPYESTETMTTNLKFHVRSIAIKASWQKFIKRCHMGENNNNKHNNKTLHLFILS
jgi:hypothetical protein